MFRRCNNRAGHYVLLSVLSAGLFLPNLGVPSLWDIDEGNNADAAREMLEARDWVVPKFNNQLRVDKPAMLYWLQMAGYSCFGVNEFAARLSSALAGLAAVLLTYELGRALFGVGCGLLGGLVLASTAMFCAAAHFANPDALLNAFTILTLLVFWRSFHRGARGWFVPAGVSAGLAVLTKGPVGVVLPAAVTGLFLLWSGRLRLLWDRRLVWGALAFLIVAVPWYAWVGAETKTDFLRGFLLVHNVGRFRAPMEGHGGPVYYYVFALVLGFIPWSPFFGPAAWHAGWRWHGMRQQGSGDAATGSDARPALRFLVCWIGVYFLFFSCAGTKLPNYILPIYAPAALLVAWFLDSWRRQVVHPPVWMVRASLACLLLIGVGASAGLLIVSGVVEVPFLRGRGLSGLESGAVLGVLPVLGAVVAAWSVRGGRRTAAVGALAAAAVLFVGGLAAWGAVAVDEYKAPRALARALPPWQLDREVRIGCYQYFQPSLVFYCQRQIDRFTDEGEVRAFLRYPLPTYLFMPASAWEAVQAKLSHRYRVLGRHRDLYQGRDIVLVSNR
jgi:4-amino-4-deoxy-L-arabinose transferase-like glycosyltransferase